MSSLRVAPIFVRQSSPTWGPNSSVVFGEMIDVDHDDRNGRGLPEGAVPFVAQRVLKIAVIEQSREGVVRRELLERRFGALERLGAAFKLLGELTDAGA